eukprot:5469488-Karenia_brevis.AAC.1
MMWRFTKPWLDKCPGESYDHAKQSEFTIVLVPYVVNDVDLSFAVNTVLRGGQTTHEFPAVANVDPQRFNISVNRARPDQGAQVAIQSSVTESFGEWFGRPHTTIEDALHGMYGRQSDVTVNKS